MPQLHQYVEAIMSGIFFFPFIAVIFTFPYLLVQYHKYGAASKMKIFVVYTFVLYMLIAYFLVILPLPDKETTVGNSIRAHLFLKPFYRINQYFGVYGVSLKSIRKWFTSFNFLQLAFNVLLTMPFGIYMRYYYRTGIVRTILASFGLSLFYELTQLSALYGIYPGPYREAEVDDLICNTLGGIAGYVAAGIFIKFLPSREEMNARSYSRGGRITGIRQLWAILTDGMIFVGAYIFIRVLSDMDIGSSIHYFMDMPGVGIAIFIFLSWLYAVITKGKTPGKSICRLRIVTKNGEPAGLYELTIRYFVLLLILAVPEYLSNIVYGIDATGKYGALAYALTIVADVFWICFVLDYIWCRLFEKREMLHAYLSGTKLMSTLGEADDEMDDTTLKDVSL